VSASAPTFAKGRKGGPPAMLLFKAGSKICRGKSIILESSSRSARRNMASGDIELKQIRSAINAVLDHLVDDLGIEKVAIDEADDFYWECPAPQVYDSSKKPIELETGRLTDDVDFVKLIQRGHCSDVSYNLVHVAPLLRYLGEKIKK
jgi:hypothetical protein